MTPAWSISHEEKLVVVHIASTIELEDVRSIYTAMATEGAFSYRKLVDLSFAPLTLDVAGIAKISQLAGAAAGDVRRGPVAFVINSEIAREMIEIFDRKISLDRPLRIFRDTAAAMRWLDEIAPPGGS
jgi:hypothetical protein